MAFDNTVHNMCFRGKSETAPFDVGQAVQGQSSLHQPAQQPQMSMQALKDSLPVGGFSGLAGIPVHVTAGPRPDVVTAGPCPAAVTAGPHPQQQPRGPYNTQVFNHGN